MVWLKNKKQVHKYKKMYIDCSSCIVFSKSGNAQSALEHHPLRDSNPQFSLGG